MVPVFLLTGFLGSGKTTLLNALMRARPPAAGKLAIVVNEFGDIGIDGALLPSGMTRQVELSNGCICCQLDEDLEKTLLELCKNEPSLESIFVETTGIAEPLPISWTLARAPLCDVVRLAAVVTVVDAEQHASHRALAPAVDNQVEYADILVVTKMDTPGGSAAAHDLLDYLEEQNSRAPVLVAPLDRIGALVWSALADPPTVSRPRAPAADEPAAHVHHLFQSVSVPIEETLDFEELTAALEGLPGGYVRVKGIAVVVDESRGTTEPLRVAFHRVGARVSAEPVSGEGQCAVVAIGFGVDAERLAACIKAAVLRS